MYEKDLAGALVGVARRRGANGFTFDDLARASRGHAGNVSDLATWLADARSTGVVVDVGFDCGPGGVLGPRRYRLAGLGREGAVAAGAGGAAAADAHVRGPAR